jgi:uncharacterized protein (DUF488 family)
MQPGSIYTIGHSNQDAATFLQLLKDNAIQVVVDVRSAPYSRYVPQFNKKEIEAAIIGAGLKYIFMGDVVGGKPSDPQYLDANGKVIYDKIAAEQSFQMGLDRLLKGLKDGWVIVLMCAEEDPLKCHRHHLVAKELETKRNIPVWHLRSDGKRIRAKDFFAERPTTTQWKLF